MDKNKNNIPDKNEAYFTYVLATVSLVLGILEYRAGGDLGFVTWCLGFASALSGGRDWINGILRK